MTARSTSATIEPEGPFSLAAALDFTAGWPPGTAQAPDDAVTMRLAFALDGFGGHAGVVLSERAGGPLEATATIAGRGTPAEGIAQARRVLGLDVDATGYGAVGERDPVVGRLQARLPGLRPVCFHSPYEAAAWSVISARVHPTQAQRSREALAREYGAVLDVGGVEMAAFPLPGRLVEVDAVPGLPAEKVRRLHEVGEAALDGRLDPVALRAMETDAALEQLRTIRGVGDFYATLILVRGAAMTDTLLPTRHLEREVARHYGQDTVSADVSEGWRPFRTWVAVLLRAAAAAG